MGKGFYGHMRPKYSFFGKPSKHYVWCKCNSNNVTTYGSGNMMLWGYFCLQELGNILGLNGE